LTKSILYLKKRGFPKLETWLAHKVQSELIAKLLWFLILRYLQKSPLCGYDIMKNVRADYGVAVGASQVYPRLAELQKKGWLTSEWTFNGTRPVKLYRLTSKGRELLALLENQIRMVSWRAKG